MSLNSQAVVTLAERLAVASLGPRAVGYVRTATLMPPNEDRCLETIASAELGTTPLGVLDASPN